MADIRLDWDGSNAQEIPVFQSRLMAGQRIRVPGRGTGLGRAMAGQFLSLADWQEARKRIEAQNARGKTQR